MGDKAQRIGCIGAGIPGHAIMQRILECGFPTVVWNRSRDKTADLMERDNSEMVRLYR